ncbi:DUF2232 domain-containing protein [Alkalicoccobacillus plakortidis]|uniref:YybS family protein n=1 Tax=Alkalicoccobacillus plakortidis TaxID=444060 RepID=A0ABT0XL48_9BACI|nr:DUF2232 domain-containing protein [Alkalicoccobacillus plakortidis]MCM2676435.1 YybS family protein [Alkalicoccobacillus plakortidis]
MNQKSAWKEGILIVGLYVILLLAALLVPVLNVVFVWTLPLPLVYFAAKHGVKPSLILYLLLCLLSWPIHLAALVLTFVFAMVGIVVGELHRRKVDGFAVLIGASLTYIFHLVIGYVVFSLGTEQSLRQLIRNQSDQVTSLLEQAGTSADQIALVTENMDFIPYIVPFLLVLIGTIMGLITVWLAGVLLRRCNIEVKRIPALRNWGFPKAFIWYYLIAFVFLLSQPEEGTTLFIAVTNVFLLIETIMTIQGLSFILFFFHFKKLPKILGILVVIITILIGPLMQIVRLIGIADLVLDLKSRLGSQRK